MPNRRISGEKKIVNRFIQNLCFYIVQIFCTFLHKTDFIMTIVVLVSHGSPVCAHTLNLCLFTSNISISLIERRPILLLVRIAKIYYFIRYLGFNGKLIDSVLNKNSNQAVLKF